MTTRQIRAARRDKLARREAATNEPVFEVDGEPTPLAEFIEVNAEIPDAVEWARTAKVGAWYPLSVVDCRRSA